MGFIKPSGGAGGNFFDAFPDNIYCVSPSSDIKPRKGDKAVPFRFLISTVFHAEWTYRRRDCSQCGFDFRTVLINQESDDSICPQCSRERLTGDGAHPCLHQWVQSFKKVITKKDKSEACIPFQYVCPEEADVIWGMMRKDGRDDFGELLDPPTKDPLLMLQEILRTELTRGRIPKDKPIFQWASGTDVQTWEAMHLSNIIPKKDRKTKEERWQTLMPEQRSLMVVMPYKANMSSSEMTMRLASFKRSVYGELFSLIKTRMKTFADTPNARVNPQETPYVLVALYNTDAKFGDDNSKYYNVMADDGAQVTQAMLDTIASERYPDPYRYNFPIPGTKAELRRVMEAAAKTAGSHDWIPWETLFDNSDWQEKNEEEPPRAAPPPSFRTPPPAATSALPRSAPPPAPPPAQVAGGGRQPTSARQPRQPAKPPGPPTLPTFAGEPAVTEATARENACGVCGLPMHPGWTSCPSCNSQYDPVTGYDAVTPPALGELQRLAWPTATGTREPASAPQSPPPAAPVTQAPPPPTPPAAVAKKRSNVVQCWSCTGDVPAKVGEDGKLTAAVQNCPRCHSEQMSEEQLEALISG